MGTRYGRLAFGPAALRRQEEIGSFVAYGARLDDPDAGPDDLEPQVQSMIRAAWHFFLGSTTPAGWPYIQHRGGPKGFVHVLDRRTLGFADVAGNRQFITAGNVESDDRVALFFIDYARRRRVKIYGRARIVEQAEDPELLARLAAAGEEALRKPERSFLVAVEAVDVNCSRLIEPLWRKESLDEAKALYQRDVREAKAEAEQLRLRVAELESQLRDLNGTR